MSVQDYLTDLDEQAELETTSAWLAMDNDKRMARRRIPAKVVSKVDKHLLSTTVLKLYTLVDSGQSASAWELFDALMQRSEKNSIPHAIVQKLLRFLRTDIHKTLLMPPLLQGLSRDQELYYRRLETLLHQVRSTQNKWSTSDFCTILDLFGRLNHVDRAEVIFRNASIYCAEPLSTDMINAALTVHVRQLKRLNKLEQGRQVSKMMSLLHTMERHGLTPTVLTYNLLLTAKAKLGDLAGVQEMYKRMLEAGLKPNERTLNIALDVYGRSPKSASFEKTLMSMLDHMRVAGINPDVVTYATTLRNAIYQHDMPTAERIYRTMITDGMQPNAYVFAHLIFGYVQTGDLEKAQEIVDSMSNAAHGVQPSAVMVAPLIQGYAKSSDYSNAYRVFGDMIDKDIPADLITYTMIANMFLKSQDVTNAVKAIDLLEGLTSIKDDNGSLKLDEAALTLLIEAYGLAGEHDLECTDITRRKRISLCAADMKHMSNRDLYSLAARDVYREIMQQTERPDDYVITTLLATFARLKQPELALKFWQEIPRETPLSTIHFNALLTSLYSSVAWFPLAKTVFEEMVQQPVFADTDTASKATPWSKSRAVVPDLATFDMMIYGASLSADHDSIRRLWQLPCRPRPNSRSSTSLKNTPNPTSLLTRSYYYAIVALLDNGDIHQAQEAYQEYCSLSDQTSSATLWIRKINELARTALLTCDNNTADSQKK